MEENGRYVRGEDEYLAKIDTWRGLVWTNYITHLDTDAMLRDD